MPSEISTRRAIEICMSRIPMDKHMTGVMAHYLANVIEKDPGLPSGDVDALRAHLLSIRDLADRDLPRKALQTRMDLITETVRRALD